MQLLVLARADGQPVRRYVFPAGEAGLYAGEDGDLRVDKPDDADQIALVLLPISERRRRVEIIVLDGAERVLVNDEALAERRWLEPSDVVRVRGARLQCLPIPYPASVERMPFVPRDAREAALIAETASGDATARLVYADWLEQHGDAAHADFLRAQDRLTRLVPQAAGFADASAELAALAAVTPAGWRARVAMARIEGCDVAFAFRCPQQWTRLAETADPGVRHCGACARDVHYALSVGEARHHASLGRCVAFDATSVREPRDLAPPFGAEVCHACRADLVPADDAWCNHCGTQRRHRHVTMGTVA